LTEQYIGADQRRIKNNQDSKLFNEIPSTLT
jgi:hypothetical protein